MITRRIKYMAHPFSVSPDQKAALERLGVETLILFGSYAQGIAGPQSDIDVGILLCDPRVLNNLPQKHQLYDALYDILSPVAGNAIKRLCDIDIVFLQDQSVNLQLKYHVAKYGVPLYEKDPCLFVNFREYVMERYADFAPLRRAFTHAILARI